MRAQKNNTETRIMRVIRTWIPLAAVFLAVMGGAAHADSTYPQNAIRLLVPASPGGGADFIARLVSPALTASLGQSVVVENKSGASGTIAAGLVANSKPDGYTLLMAQSTSIVIVPHIYAHLPYDTMRDLAPVTLVVRVPNILVVNPKLPAKTVAEFIALAKAKPGTLSYGSSGNGSPSDLAGKIFDKDAGVTMVHVPYKGAGPAVSALLGDQIQVMFAPVTAVLPLVRAKQLRALGVTSTARLDAVPDVPTIAESGLPGFDVTSWFGIFAAAHTPPEIIARLNHDVVLALKDPRVASAIANQASEAVGDSSEAFAAFVRAEDNKYSAIVKGINAQSH
jgi:tripartite-type tricarboxylate transporter receptor subunit TctC